MRMHLVRFIDENCDFFYFLMNFVYFQSWHLMFKS